MRKKEQKGEDKRKREMQMQERVIWTNGAMSVNAGELWLAPFEVNILCKYNVENMKMEQCIVWEDAHCQSGASYSVVKFKDMFVVVPARENVVRLVKNNELVKEYIISENAEPRENYKCALVVGERLLLFPLEENAIIEVGENEIKKIPSPVMRASCAVIYNNDVFIVNNSNCIWKYNVETETFNSIELEEDMQVCWMGIWGRHIIITTLDGKVLLADDGTFVKLQEIAIAPEGDYFSTGIIQGDKVILFNYKDAANILSINLIDMSQRHTLIAKDSFWSDWSYNAFGVPVEEQGKIYVMSPKHRALFVIDGDGNILERQHLVLAVNDEIGTRLIEQNLVCNKIVNESDICTLDHYLRYVKKNVSE